MKIELFLALLAAFICSAASYVDHDGASLSLQLEDPGGERWERSVVSNELARRRRRNSDFKAKRQCNRCSMAPTSCCTCCPCCGSGGTSGNGGVTTDNGLTSTNTDSSQISGTTTEPSLVVYVGSQNFTTIVINSPKFWIVIFTYQGPGCKYCRDLDRVITETIALLPNYPDIGIAIFYVDFGDHRPFLTNTLGIKIFPSVYLYCLDKENPYDYGPPKTGDELITSMIYLITRPRIAVGNCADETEPFPTSNVYELNDRNFVETIGSCTEAWVVNFYLAWPDACKKFFAVFEDAARKLDGRVKFGSFYQTAESPILQKHGVSNKACWVKMFPKGEKFSCVLDYNEGKHSSALNKALVPWVEKYLVDDEIQNVCGGTTSTSVDESTTTLYTETEETTQQPTTTRRTTTTTRRPTTTRTTTTTQKPTTTRRTTTTTPRPTTKTTTTRKPTTTTTRKPTTTTTRKPTTTTTTTRRPTTPKAMTRTPIWMTTTQKKATIKTTKSTTPTPLTTSGGAVIKEVTVAPGPPESLPKTDVNEAWCKYRCCIVYFLPQKTKCEMACHKKFITTLERVATRQGAGCALYFQYQGIRPDFEQTFALFHFPMILIVRSESRTYTTHDGTVSEPALDKYVEAFVHKKLPMKHIPLYVPQVCEGEAC